MSGCNLENWTVSDLASALINEHKDNKFIRVPMFQRGKIWDKDKEANFIDSLKKGFPVGSLLFYRSVEGQNEIYTLTDGLQRCGTIKNFAQKPTEYFRVDEIDDNLITSIYKSLEIKSEENKVKSIIKLKIEDFIKMKLDINDIQYSEFADFISDEFPTVHEKDKSKEITTFIKPFLKDYKEKYEGIVKTYIPVIIYMGDIGDLPEIFERINQGGTQLSKYQVFAASWSASQKKVKNPKITELILKKYDKMVDDGYTLDCYNKDELQKTKYFNLFEYVFGFGKYICDEFPYLFEPDIKVDEINPMGFELLNACLGKSNDEIKDLHSNLYDIDVDVFEDKIIEIIRFINNVLSKIIRFRGNRRKEKKVLHSKNQIISIIASTFREKYDVSNLDRNKKSWKASKKKLEENLINHYVYDIIRKEWNSGAAGKIYSILNNNKYLKGISKISWEATLNSWFQDYMARNEVLKVSAAREIEKVFLNCIYAPIFSAEDQLSMDKFDIEHIATKDAMKKILKIYDGKGLPISSIANLCLLPERVNRSKKDKTFYQDVRYNEKVDMRLIEEKYSFTEESDLDWLDLPYTKDDFDLFKDYYFEFLKKRFDKQKEKFYISMKIVDK